VEILDLDLIFRSPKEYAKKHRRDGEEASLWRSTMVVQNNLKHPRKSWGKGPFYRKPKIWPFGDKLGLPVYVGLGPG
jgi:hypothetical protein